MDEPEMKLWLFERIGETDWDQTHAAVVRAPNKFKARLLLDSTYADHFNRADVSRCSELSIDGREEVVIVDFNAG